MRYYIGSVRNRMYAGLFTVKTCNGSLLVFELKC